MPFSRRPPVRCNSGITACGSLSWSPSSPCLPDSLRDPLQPCAHCCPRLPPVWSAGSVRSRSWSEPRHPQPLARQQSVLSVVWVTERRLCPCSGRSPPPSCLGASGCSSCTPWACGSDRKKNITQIIGESLNKLLVLFVFVTVDHRGSTPGCRGLCPSLHCARATSESSGKALPFSGLLLRRHSHAGLTGVGGFLQRADLLSSRRGE